ncbi:hypothetical protein Dimus_015779 [Dionaea muscipula]
MVRERSSLPSISARNPGGWILVFNRRFLRSNTMIRGRGGRLITLFVEDIPDSMDYVEMNKLFAKFGVVRDVYFPKKRSMSDKRFGFLRYDCSVTAEIAIQKTDGVWMQDKELKVKFADLHKHQGGLWQRKDNNVTKHHSTEYLLDLFAAKGNFLVRRMGNRKTEFSFGREVWLSCYGVPVHAWNVSTFCRIGRYWGEVVQKMRIMDGSIPFDIRVAEEQALFICNSDFRCGCTCHGWEDEQLQYAEEDEDDDDVAGEAADRSVDDAINQKMRLMVGSIPFGIMVAEEQALFICNLDFRCGCTCHGWEDEQLQYAEEVEDDDDVAGEETDRSADDDRNDSVSFIANT